MAHTVMLASIHKCELIEFLKNTFSNISGSILYISELVSLSFQIEMYKAVQLHRKFTPSIFRTRLDYKINFPYILFSRLNLFTNKMKKFILNPHYDYDVIVKKKLMKYLK